MTLGELFGLEAKLPEGLSRVPITGLAADSREVKPGYLFAALPGVNTDGTRFIAVLPTDRDVLESLERHEGVGRPGTVQCTRGQNLFSPS